MRPLKGKRMNRVEPARNLLILQETSQQDPSDWIAIKQRIDRDAPDIEVRIANVGHSLLLMLWTAPAPRHRSAVDWLSRPKRFKEVRQATTVAFEVEGIGEGIRGNADKVDPGIGKTRLGQRIFECVFLIGTRSAQSIMASGFTAAQTGRTHDRTRPMLQHLRKFLPTRRPHMTQSGHWQAAQGPPPARYRYNASS
jgi:hypothetical protein